MPEQQDRKGPKPPGIDEDPLTLRPGANRAGGAAATPAEKGRTGVASKLRGPPPSRIPADTVGRRVARAWTRHPVVAFWQHGSRIAFYRQLHSLVRSGVGMPIALADMARYAPDRRTRNALAAIAKDLSDGSGLGEAMSRHAGTFDDTTVELLIFAEETGKLEPVLARILDHMEKQQRLRWTAIFASLWPAYLFVGFVIFGPLMDVATAVAANADSVNYGTVFASALIRNLLIGGGVLGAFFLGPLGLAALGIDAAWDRIKMSLPLAGRIIRAGYASRFFLGLGLSLSAGVEVARALRISVRASGSPALQLRASVVESRVRAGGSLVDGLETMKLFDCPQLGTVAIGEKTGRLDESLEQLAKDCQDTAVRGTRVLILVALFFVAIIAVAIVLRPMLATIFGPIKRYYDLQKQIE